MPRDSRKRVAPCLARRLVVFWLIASICLLGPGESAADIYNDPGFVTEVVATLSPFTLVGLAWAPDGRLFVWQKNGIVRVIKQGVLLPTPFINLSSQVNTFDDRGFWGLAFHPDFANNGFVYMTYVYEEGGFTSSSGPKTSRLTRVTANPSNPDVALPGSEVVILGSIGTPPCSAHPAGADCIPADGGSHSIGTLRFAPDGTLFLGNGDGSDGDALSLRAQDLGSWSGKILRVNDDGGAPGDNPFDDGTDSIQSKVWLSGVRNPFRFAIHPATGELYFGDVGWNTWEEVNRGVAGGNYGWPCYEGAGPQSFFQGQFPQCAQLPASAVIAPFHAYGRSVGAAVIGGPVYTGTAYPEQYRGSFFFADYVGSWIRRVVIDADGLPVSVQPFATSIEAPVTLEQGPDGMIYYLSFSTGQIRRIRFNGPSAAASATPTNGYSPLTVSFSSSGSVDPGGGPLTYLWEFGDGAISNAANPVHTYTAPGVTTFNARLTVTNTAGLTSTATLKITVGSTPPAPTIATPADGTPVLAGQTIVYQGSASDPDDGALPGSSLTWTVLLHHNTHVHTFVGGTGSQGSFVAEDHGTVGTFSYEIILTATDSSGLQASTSVTLPVSGDGTPPTAPSALVAVAVGSGRIDLTWTASTDNVGVTGYRLERCQGGGCSSFVPVATPTGTSFSDTGLAAATSYSYRVRAADAAGNLSGYSNIASATTAQPSPDTTAPTAPSGLGAVAVSSSQIDLTWTASTDNVGVTGYRLERCQGAGCATFVEIATPVGTVFSDAGRAPQTSYSYRARATDAAGNLSGYSNVASATTPAAAGLVAAYGFDEGAGTTVGDASGNGHTGMIIGSTWTGQGRYGAALSFDGVDDYVELDNSPAMNPAGAITISAWVNPVGSNLTQYVVTKNNLPNGLQQYFLRLQAPAELRLGIRTTADHTLTSTGNVITPNAWNHVAGTWDGQLMRLYVNGALVGTSTSPVTGTMTNNGVAARIGRRQDTSSPFQGRIDELRVYNRALSQAEIQSDMNTPVGTPAAPDTTAPTAPTGLGAVAVSSSQINLTWTASTDNVGVTGYRVERCQGAGCATFVEIATPAGTAFSDTGRTPQTSYSYRARATDAAGNLSGYSNVASATTPSGAGGTGLVAAYGFDEGVGTTVGDASGNGNTGTITGATWTGQGRYGGALSFDGVNDVVQVAAAASLNVTTGMTLEAWIFPTAPQGGWRTILQREVDAYFLNASNSTGALRPSGGGTLGSTVGFVSGTTASPVNAWTHVALTYDGAMLRLYVNGVLAASQARTGSVQTTSKPLWIGGNSPYGEYFQGRIDELRVYNRALSQAEIQSDMNTPVGP